MRGKFQIMHITGEMATAIRKKSDIKFGVYHSLFEWYNPLYMEDAANNYTTNTFVKVNIGSHSSRLAFTTLWAFSVDIWKYFSYFSQ